MCRIDAPFGNRSLDEKKDPVERFVQALDEFEVQGNFRTLLIKHFSENWIDVFYNSSRLEEALTTANEQSSEPEKCVALAFYKNVNIRFRLQPFLDGDSYRESLPFKFLADVANTYFPTSPYCLYKAGIEKHLPSYAWFVRNHYGDEFFFTKEFFSDDTFSSLNKNERMRFLWECFHFIAPPFDWLKYRTDDSTLVNGLLSLASSNDESSSPCEHAQSIQLGLEFLRAWIKYDAEMGRISFDLSSFFWGTSWEQLESLIWQKDFDDEEAKSSLTNWFDTIERDLKKVLILNFNAGNVEGLEGNEWANYIDRYFSDIYHHIRSDIDWKTYDHDEFDIRLKKELEDLCSQLTPKQLEAWIKWSIQQDFDRILSNKQRLPELSKSSERWVCETFFGVWKDLFLANLDTLEASEQLHVLSATFPARRGEPSEFIWNCSEWWRGLFNQLPETDDFPKTLIPEWTVTATRCLQEQNLLPYIDKSIGILRKEATGACQPEEQKRHDDQLKQLLEGLERSHPNKSFRHRLLLMRSYALPLTDESISLGSPLNQSNLTQWYIPLCDLATRLFELHLDVQLTESAENRLKALMEPYVTCTNYLAEFCLSRLRLRKGEKAREKQYIAEQIVEQSSVWRQGYLKALTELGVDLNGKVHKAVYFIKQSDPDPDVRAIASECYKAVRRRTKKNSTIPDLKRGIIAAEWWLLICQRQNLGMVINHDDALKTRRNLMRNP
ncbi:hypothetical protein AB733_20235 [Photobacterium swingsii]|uniref:Uncharacterized protein n=1 Tax=Photobacterium swingsii TaxID=680026 RepID=A0A0J8V6V4_9GAMM|nr:hypothetical protein [Photobacterium swingsii]KMV28991.1 hypothetical protein AB733_20235 [Photobacterium swingsii]PSW22761.1 hypothetical protein C9I94_18425 [Photobacterium swingsii]